MNILALATRLAAMDGDNLRALVAGRGVPQRGIRDYFDLAEMLVSEQSIRDALTRLDRFTLGMLMVACDLAGDRPPTAMQITERLSALSGEPLVAESEIADEIKRARDLLLVEASFNTADTQAAVIPDADVCRQLASWPAEGLPDAAELARRRWIEPVSAGDGPAPATTDPAAAERAFRSTSATTELLSALAREPARALARGGLALPDARRLAQGLGVPVDEVADLVRIAEKTGLTALEEGLWFVTESGEQWLKKTTASRWAALAEAWLGDLAVGMQSLLGSTRATASRAATLRDYADWLFPASRGRMDARIVAFSHGADLLGITVHGVPSSPGWLLIDGCSRESVNAMTALFPAEVDRVYLQHDLTVVAPGPLVPAIDARLRSLSDVESRAHASTYRISAASIQTALGTGATAGSILEFLAGISLTGVPQPLDYLVSETAARYGLLRVGAVQDETGARSYVSSTDTELLGTLTVDQSLSWLGLVRASENRLNLRYERDVVFWSLSDAKYPVAAEDENHRILPLRRHRIARAQAPGTAAHDPADPSAGLVQRLLEGRHETAEQADRAWLVRELDASIAAKATIVVTVDVANGKTVDYLLEPASIFGGRLRARDRGRDVERTFPISRIVRLAPAESFRASD